jgi:hypothetical protein
MAHLDLLSANCDPARSLWCSRRISGPRLQENQEPNFVADHDDPLTVLGGSLSDLIGVCMRGRPDMPGRPAVPTRAPLCDALTFGV